MDQGTGNLNAQFRDPCKKSGKVVWLLAMAQTVVWLHKARPASKPLTLPLPPDFSGLISSSAIQQGGSHMNRVKSPFRLPKSPGHPPRCAKLSLKVTQVLRGGFVLLRPGPACIQTPPIFTTGAGLMVPRRWAATLWKVPTGRNLEKPPQPPPGDLKLQGGDLLQERRHGVAMRTVRREWGRSNGSRAFCVCVCVRLGGLTCNLLVDQLTWV